MFSPLDVLVATEEIKKLKARYFRCLDTKDWTALDAVFAPDAVFDLRSVDSMRHPRTGVWDPPPGGEDKVFIGRGTIVEMIRASIQDLYTIHHGHMPEISVLNASSATGIWPMQDVLRHASGELLLQGSGYYEETYENVGDGWQIKTSRLYRLFIVGALGTRPHADSTGPV